MAKKRIVDDSNQLELIPECSDASKKKLRKLLAKMDSKDEAKKVARAEYDAAEQDVIAFIRDEEKVLPDKDGNYRLRLDADESIVIGHGKSKVKVTRVSNAETDESETDDFEDDPSAGDEQ